MERIFRVKTKDGYEEFKNENEANAFEAERKAIIFKRENKAHSIKEDIKNLKSDIEEYKELGGCAIRMSDSEILYFDYNGDIYLEKRAGGSERYRICAYGSYMDDIIRSIIL